MLPQSPDEQPGEPGFGEPSLEPFPSVESSNDFNQVHPAYQHHHNSSADSSISNPFAYPRSHQQQSSSGSNFHIPPSGLSSSPNDLTSPAVAAFGGRQQLHSHSYSQPSFPTQVHGGMLPRPASQPVRHWCAACGKPSPVPQSFACTDCICGICRDCADVMFSMQDRGSRCPKCGMGGKFKPIMLNFEGL